MHWVSTPRVSSLLSNDRPEASGVIYVVGGTMRAAQMFIKHTLGVSATHPGVRYTSVAALARGEMLWPVVLDRQDIILVHGIELGYPADVRAARKILMDAEATRPRK